jgi:hypothetical protein
MHKNVILLTTAIIATLICLLSALVLLRQPSLPPDLAWSAERLTPDQAEAISDSLVDLVYELKADRDTNQGRGATQIVQSWQGSLMDQPVGQHLFRLLHFLNERDKLDIRQLAHVLDLAGDIDDVAEDGEMTITSQIDGPDVTILIESLKTGEIRRVVIRP